MEYNIFIYNLYDGRSLVSLRKGENNCDLSRETRYIGQVRSTGKL